MNKNLIKYFRVGNIDADVGSDWHRPITADSIREIIYLIKAQKKGKVFFCLGDLFNAKNGEDTSPFINELLHNIHHLYDQIFFVAGNHELRGRKNPWRSFDLPRNVICPIDNQPIVLKINETKILVANIFYDQKFINPSLLNLTPGEISKQYIASADGKYLLNGDSSNFEIMKKNTAKALMPDMDVLITHALPHPSLVRFKVDNITNEMYYIGITHGIKFVCDLENDELEVKSKKRWPNSTAYRAWWNNKSFLMGSNVIGDESADPKDGLIVIHGHHHRNDLQRRNVKDKKIYIITHQPF